VTAQPPTAAALADVPAPHTAPGAAPARILGPIDATSIVIGAIVGVGIFFTPARMAGLTGSGSLLLLAWAIGGVIALCGALTFAELGDAYGPLPAFLFVFCNATAVQAGAIGVIAAVCANHIFAVAGIANPSAPRVLSVAVALIAAVTAANIVGVRWGARIQNFTVFAKILALAVIVAIAAIWGRTDVTAAIPSEARPPQHPGAVAGVMAALVPALFSFGGWQHALWISGEVRQPGRNLPRAIVGGVLIVIVVYLTANWAYLRLIGAAAVAHTRTPAADAVTAVFPNAGRVIAAAITVSAFGVLNAQLLSGPRLVFGMARDGRFFGSFARIGRFGTPVAAILLLSGMALVLLLAVGPERVDQQLLTGVVFIDTIFFLLTGAAVIVLRIKSPRIPRPVRVAGYPLVPVLFVAGELFVLVGAYADAGARTAALIGVAWILAAAMIYFLFFRRPVSEP
jgi:basic amino acid/polyamine antiporter, APA family